MGRACRFTTALSNHIHIHSCMLYPRAGHTVSQVNSDTYSADVSLVSSDGSDCGGRTEKDFVDLPWTRKRTFLEKVQNKEILPDVSARLGNTLLWCTSHASFTSQPPPYGLVSPVSPLYIHAMGMFIVVARDGSIFSIPHRL